MVTLELLKHGVINAVEEMVKSSKPFGNAIMISSRGYLNNDDEDQRNNSNIYHFSRMNTFETCIVETLIQQFVLLLNIGNDRSQPRIGWEVNYPMGVVNGQWNRSKLDIGLEYLPDSKHLFKCAVEVKKWIVPAECNDQSTFTPYSIWEDIFKIAGYGIDNQIHKKHYSTMNEEHIPFVGKDKYILLFFQFENPSNRDDIDVIINNTFCSFNNIKNWYTNDLKQQYKDLYTFVKEYFIISQLGWKSEAVNYVLDKFSINKTNIDGFKLLDIIQIGNGKTRSYVYTKKTACIGAALMRLNI